jgi:hypothetical protein
MKHRNSVLGFIAAVSLTLRDGDAAHAQGQGITQEVQTYAGDLFGDRLGSADAPMAVTRASVLAPQDLAALANWRGST